MVDDEGECVDESKHEHGVACPLMEDLKLLMRHSGQRRDQVCLCAQRPVRSAPTKYPLGQDILTGQKGVSPEPSSRFGWQSEDYSRTTLAGPQASNMAWGLVTLLRTLGLATPMQTKTTRLTKEEDGSHQTQQQHPQRRRPVPQGRQLIALVGQIPQPSRSLAPDHRSLHLSRRILDRKVHNGEHADCRTEEVDRVQGVHQVRLIPGTPSACHHVKLHPPLHPVLADPLYTHQYRQWPAR